MEIVWWIVYLAAAFALLMILVSSVGSIIHRAHERQNLKDWADEDE